VQNSLELKITDLSRGGAGVARTPEGEVIFVPLTLPGDRVRVQIVDKQKRYSQAELLEVIEASPERVDPRCSVFGRCGGCQWQHIPYPLQWKTKTAGVEHALRRVSLTSPKRPEEFPADLTWGYRNRIQLRGLRTDLGFYARRSHDLVPIASCPVARPEINKAIDSVRTEGQELPQQYKVEVEVLPDGSVAKSWNSRHANLGFRQVHDQQNGKLVNWIRENLTAGRPLLDLFGGNGNLSLELASQMTRIDCVDMSTPPVRPESTPENFHFHRSGVLPWLKKKQRSTEAVEISAIVDPPREGLAENTGEILASLKQLGVTEVIAVGCDPDSWARDLSHWTKKGWKLQKIALFDFFPQTPHIESVALLRL
jgi:tRNA/tmRNA/rRNA uracil-C5-methylase (TrmA/RlmC/RlmD family)